MSDGRSLQDHLPEYRPLTPPRDGRIFGSERKVRLGDVDPSGRLRLDALTRYCQDVSNDDTTDAGLDDDPGWVVRSTVVDELEPARLYEPLTFHTFCSGLGKRWAERRLAVRGRLGARYEVATLWVCVDTRTGQPIRLTPQFLDLYAGAADGRTASARQRNPKPAAVSGRPSHHHQWQLRRVDFDTLDHVNNAAYWAAVEEWMEPFRRPRRIRLEYADGVTERPELTIERVSEPDHMVLWWWAGDGGPSASASVQPASVQPASAQPASEPSLGAESAISAGLIDSAPPEAEPGR